MRSNQKASDLKALSCLAVPCAMAGVAAYSFVLENRILYWVGTILLSFIFAQTFILLHECGHMNYFKSKAANKFFGNMFGLLTGIPFFTWRQMHNLHHRWTGWRDLDPTTEKTAKSVVAKRWRPMVLATMSPSGLMRETGWSRSTAKICGRIIWSNAGLAGPSVRMMKLR